MALDRQSVLNALREKLRPLETVYAMWEGGAAANNRLDQWSDIDLQLDVEDDSVEAVARAAESAIEELAGIEIRHVMPQPTWHGHWQAFYKLTGASPFLLIDLVIITHSSDRKFVEPELHGKVVVHFDKRDVVRPQPLDTDEFVDRLAGRMEQLRITFPLFQILVTKELHRGHGIEALQYYHEFTLRPLIEVLGMKHRPFQYNFSTRYIYDDFPPEVVKRLEGLYFLADADQLAAAHSDAVSLFQETVSSIDRASLGERLRKAAQRDQVRPDTLDSIPDAEGMS